MTPDALNNIANAIQLALAPVFLLTGIAGMLNVMSGRLSRIIDRGRALTEKPQVIATYHQDELYSELKMLERRRHVTSIGITMSTVAALLVCLVIVALFIEVMIGIPLTGFIGILFVLSTIALVIGLGYFLREVHLSANTVRIRLHGH